MLCRWSPPSPHGGAFMSTMRPRASRRGTSSSMTILPFMLPATEHQRHSPLTLEPRYNRRFTLYPRLTFDRRPTDQPTNVVATGREPLMLPAPNPATFAFDPRYNATDGVPDERRRSAADPSVSKPRRMCSSPGLSRGLTGSEVSGDLRASLRTSPAFLRGAWAPTQQHARAWD